MNLISIQFWFSLLIFLIYFFISLKYYKKLLVNLLKIVYNILGSIISKLVYLFRLDLEKLSQVFIKMKSILLHYRLVFFKPIYIVSVVFLFFIILLGAPFQYLFPEHILILRIFIFSSIFLLAFLNFSRYIWFISKYKKEALNLSNEELEKKFPNLLKIEKNTARFAKRISNYNTWLKFQLPVIASKFNEQDPDYEEKRKFVYKITLKFHIAELFLLTISIAFGTLSYYFIITIAVSTKDNNLSVIPNFTYSFITSIIFFVVGFAAWVWLNQTTIKLIQVFRNLLTVSVEESKKDFKSIFIRFYLPKEN